MSYRISSDLWIEHQAERCKGVLMVNMDPTEEYTVTELLTMLADFGLVYSPSEYTAIGAILVAEGFLETT